MAGERGYHAFANLIWRNWSVIASVGDRRQIVPTGWYGTVFGDSGSLVQDERGFLEVSYQRDLPGGRQIRWRTYYDEFRSENRFDLSNDGSLTAFDPNAAGVAVMDARQGGNGDWIGTQISYRFPVRHLGTLTAGGESTWDLRATQFNREVWPTRQQLITIDRPQRSAAGFFQLERDLSRTWKLYAGGRLDGGVLRRLFFSPSGDNLSAVQFMGLETALWKCISQSEPI